MVPGVRLLRRIRVPRALAVLVVVLMAFGALTGVALLIANETAQLAADLPRYQLTMRREDRRPEGDHRRQRHPLPHGRHGCRT